MNIPLDHLGGMCRCGKTHELHTKQVVIGSGATSMIGEIARSLGLSSRCVVICDSNTQPFARLTAQSLGTMLHPLKPCIILNPQGLHADEKAVAKVLQQLPADARWLVAAGSGTIHDVTRYVATQRNIPFISFPTAASVDGFTSTVSAMTWQGFKKTLPGVAPLAVVADTDVFAYAPYRLSASGIGDVLGKYISLADWSISHLLTGEDFCPEIYSLTRQAVDRVLASLKDIRAYKKEGFEALMYALLLSGLSMQMWGNSRPASGAEHHLSHLWEMEVLNPCLDAFHGEKVGVGLNLLLPVYRHMGRLPDLSAHLTSYAGLPLLLLEEKFGALSDIVIQENTPDPLEAVNPNTFTDREEQIREILCALPDERELQAAMKQACCYTSLKQIGLENSILADSLALAPFVRNRLTFLRACKLLDSSAVPHEQNLLAVGSH